MELFESLLIVSGSLCIVGSFILSYLFQSKSEHKNTSREKEMMWEKKNLEQEQNEKVKQIREEVLFLLREEMNQIANEKMMAIHEYSEQILEKLSSNQKEAVFLYKMLIDKEEAVKKQMIHFTPITEPETVEEKKETFDYETFLAQYQSNREKILALHEKEISVADISKQLNVGQGEVTLVLNLYGRKG